MIAHVRDRRFGSCIWHRAGRVRYMQSWKQRPRSRYQRDHSRSHGRRKGNLRARSFYHNTKWNPRYRVFRLQRSKTSKCWNLLRCSSVCKWCHSWGCWREFHAGDFSQGFTVCFLGTNLDIFRGIGAVWTHMWNDNGSKWMKTKRMNMTSGNTLHQRACYRYSLC